MIAGLLNAAAPDATETAGPHRGGGTMPYSPAVLASVVARIPRAQRWAAIAGPVLSQWYVYARADRVVVGLTRITAVSKASSGTQ